MTKIKDLLPPSIRLNVMVICETVVLLSLALGVLLYFSHRALRQEAIHDAEETLDATVQHIDNILLSVEQSAGNIYWKIVFHIDQPDKLDEYCRKVVETNPYITSSVMAFEPDFR